ncbi:uncharacterized protein METZ01_LOCUS452289, partial [marine metagenome]
MSRLHRIAAWCLFASLLAVATPASAQNVADNYSPV